MSAQSVPRSAVLRENVLIEPRQFPRQFPRHVDSLAGRLLGTFREWRRRIQSRHELAMLSELERKDLGFPDRIEAEISKPFWRA